MKADLVIVGGGPAGLAAAISAREHRVERILLLEREPELGGILNQCIHNGFGLHIFQEELTGPEYAARFVEKLEALNISYERNTTVLSIRRDKEVTAINPVHGLFSIQAGAVILAMGCQNVPEGH